MIVIAVLANLFSLATLRYPEWTLNKERGSPTDVFFYLFFTSEVCFKLYAYGYKFYMLDRFNKADVFIVILTTLD